jgi:hypothetical protein
MVDWTGGSRVAFLSLVVLACGCFAPPAETRGTPLYQVGPERPPANQVASLGTILPGGSSPGGGASSFIKSIDGRDVSTTDTAFELLPGCHVVETQSGLVVTNETMTFRGQLGTRVFPFQMRAGYQYLVLVEFSPIAGGSVHVSVSGEERDARGTRMQQVAAAKSTADVTACRAWMPPPS